MSLGRHIIYPSYYALQKAKDQCYQPEESIIISVKKVAICLQPYAGNIQEVTIS